MLGLLTLGPKFTRPACHMQPTTRAAAAQWVESSTCRWYPVPAATTNRYMAPELSSKPGAGAGRWDRQTRGWTLDRFNMLTAYYADRVIKAKHYA